jgi:tRNA nucleotidyltransferase/poly(A) polymerase
MSDYMFMLENHLGSDQNRVVAAVQAAAAEAQVQVFLAGGAMRDMLGAFPIRDLDFVVEGNGIKLAKAVAEKTGASIVYQDDLKKLVELVFAGGATAEISMARQEKYSRPGQRPQVAAASIQEDLRRRDFSINAIALSLNRASTGLLLDPTNGLADLHNRELRALRNYSFYDDPARLLRLVRFRVRLGFTVDERTQQQFDNALQEGVQKLIPPRALLLELRDIANEQQPAEVVKALTEAELLAVFSPALTGAKVNTAGLARLEKAMRLLDGAVSGDWTAPFLYVLTEKLSPKERAALVKSTELPKARVEAWQRLESHSRKLEQALKSAQIKKPSGVYRVLSKARPEEILFLLCHSPERTVHDRIRNYVQKYLPAAQEITEAELLAVPGEPGTPKHEKAREAFVAARLDRRPKKVEPPPPPPPEPPPRPRGRSL